MCVMSQHLWMPMDISESNDLKLRPIASDRLFYDRWRYCIKIYLNEISAMRGLPDSETIDKILSERDHWRQQVRLRWPGTNIIHANRSISAEDRENLKSFAEFLRPQTHNFKITISVSLAWIYTNDINLLTDIIDLPYVKSYGINEATVVKPRDVVVLKNSKHTHRSYFRSCKLDADQKEKLCNFLHSQTDIRISSALNQWLDVHWTRTQDYYFVDHVGENWTLLLSLICPRIIRKTLPIVTK